VNPSLSQRRRDEVAADVRRLRRKVAELGERAGECARKGYADLAGGFHAAARGAREAAMAWLRYGRHFSKDTSVKGGAL
jgi:hypothetical protein